LLIVEAFSMVEQRLPELGIAGLNGSQVFG